MNDTKPAIASVGIWGSLLALVSAFDAALSSLHVLPVNFLSDGASLLVATIGGIVSLIGRLKAKKEISGIIKG